MMIPGLFYLDKPLFGDQNTSDEIVYDIRTDSQLAAAWI